MVIPKLRREEAAKSSFWIVVFLTCKRNFGPEIFSGKIRQRSLLPLLEKK